MTLCHKLLIACLWLALVCQILHMVGGPQAADHFGNIYHRPMSTTSLSAHATPSLMCAVNIRSRSSLPAIHKNTAPYSISIVTVLLLVSGDMHSNPGPQDATIYPCGYCELRVGWSHQAVCCDGCDIWYHRSCMEIGTDEYESLNKDIVV